MDKAGKKIIYRRAAGMDHCQSPYEKETERGSCEEEWRQKIDIERNGEESEREMRGGWKENTEVREVYEEEKKSAYAARYTKCGCKDRKRFRCDVRWSLSRQREIELVRCAPRSRCPI